MVDVGVAAVTAMHGAGVGDAALAFPSSAWVVPAAYLDDAVSHRLAKRREEDSDA